ncbi:hypothetical protein HN011_005112 [Eciton burchellii]|nr:hypothetical protein HN011_005112 [Eciton burchellii]
MLMVWFEQVESWNKKEEAKSGEGKYQSRSRDKDEGGRSEQRKRDYFNCELPDHVSRDCPTKTQNVSSVVSADTLRPNALSGREL